MRIPLTALSVNGRWPWPWNRSSWRGWLYLTILVFVSGRLFVGQECSLTLTRTSTEKIEPTLAGVGDNIFAKQHDRGLKMAITATTWSSSSPLGQTPKNAEDHINQVDINNTEGPTSSPEGNNEMEESTVKIDDEKVNRKTEEQVREEREKEHRYWLRSERIKQVCSNWGVVSNRLIFATNNDTRPVHSPDSTNLPGKTS